MTRRKFLLRAGPISALAAGGGGLITLPAQAGLGTSVAEAFDREMDQFMSARQIPGGALAVIKDRRLVYARGYGWADREKQEATRAESLFRIASISKPFTAVAILRLLEAGRLDLEDRAFERLELKPLSNDGKPDAALNKITIRHLLHHTGGWDRDKSGDPMFRSILIARAADVTPPAMPEQIIRYMLGRPLDFDPGVHYAYSNFGYCVLGRIIEKLSGTTYEKFVQQEVLAPASIKRMRLGHSLSEGRAEGEVKYYMKTGEHGRSVFPTQTGRVPEPYGGFCLEAMDSHGGWLASAVDLVRFAAALDSSNSNCLLNLDTRRLLYEPPAVPVSRKPDGTLASAFYACGWQVRPVGTKGKANYWHNGSLPGTATMLVRRADGLAWAALFNQRSEDSKLSDNAIDPALHRAADAVSEWPIEDLFAKYP
jgi:CubicO group peptidase (beta-lactamase class C family)